MQKKSVDIMGIDDKSEFKEWLLSTNRMLCKFNQAGRSDRANGVNPSMRAADKTLNAWITYCIPVLSHKAKCEGTKS